MKFIYANCLNPAWVAEQEELEALAQLESEEHAADLW